MRKHLWSMVTLWIVVSVGLLCAADHCRAKQSPFGLPQTKAKADDGKDAKAVTLPENLDSDQLNAILAQLSDVQVRRLLIEELKKTAAAKQEKKPEVSGFTGSFRNWRNRFNCCTAGWHTWSPAHYRRRTFSRRPCRTFKVGEAWSIYALMFAVLAGLFVVALAGEWFYRRATADLRQRIQTTPPVDWTVKAKRLALGAVIDLGSMLVFTVATLILFLPVF